METVSDLQSRFETDGFVVLRGFLAGSDLADLIAHVDRYVEMVVPAMPPEEVFFEDRSDPTSLKQIQRMGDHDAWFHDLFTASRVREVAEQLLRGPVVPKNVQYFNKPAGTGRPTPPHQDGQYFMLTPCEAVTMWLAIDDVDEENGCVRYVPGSHRNGLREHARTETLGFSQGIVDYPTPEDSVREVAVPARQGDLLVHHAMTVHRSDGNRSSHRSRRALGFVYYSQQARQDSERHAAYQQMLTSDMKTQGRI